MLTFDLNGDGTFETTNAGAVYRYDGVTGELKQVFTLGSKARASDDFGWSVAAVGSDVLVGAFGVDIAASEGGAAFLFDGATGALKHTFTLGSQARASDFFGISVSGVGKDVLVGAPRVDLDTNGDGTVDTLWMLALSTCSMA